ncbi:MAG TPA: hypothetical protein VF884_01500 [Nitrososphaeraceae archaeon]
MIKGTIVRAIDLSGCLDKYLATLSDKLHDRALLNAYLLVVTKTIMLSYNTIMPLHVGD